MHGLSEEKVTAESLTLPVWTRRAWPTDRGAHRQRLVSALAAALVNLLLGYALVVGLGYRLPLALEEPLKLFDVAVPPPPPPPPPASAPPSPSRRLKADRAEGVAAPPSLEAAPRPIVAPPPRVRLEIVEPIAAAPVAGAGSAASAGATPLPGPGTGATGTRTGTGSGAAGSGPGDGGGSGIATRARLIRGRIQDSDYPRGAYREQIGGIVIARLTIGTEGQVMRCLITDSSGNSELDTTTCRLIERRFRYEPARDRTGKPVVSEVGWRQTWWLEARR